MSSYTHKLQGFVFREPGDKADVKLLSDIQNHGWHIVGIPDDEEGPGFAFTVGVYLRALQPEILIMGVPMGLSYRILNVIAEYLIDGGTLTPGVRYSKFVEGREVLFNQVHQTQFCEYLGYANWFYRPSHVSFPALQCIWPDSQGRFPQEDGFDSRFANRQLDLSLHRN